MPIFEETGSNAQPMQEDMLCNVLLNTCGKVHFNFHIVSVPDYKVLMMNNAQIAAFKSIGVSNPLEEFIGKRHWDVFPNWKSVILPLYQEVGKDGEPQLCRNIRLETPAGVTFWDSSFVPQIDVQSKKVTSISILSLDVTERKRTEDALRESEEAFRTDIEQSTDGIFVLTPDDKIILSNKAIEQITGYTRDEVNTYGWFKLAQPDPKQREHIEKLSMDVIHGRRPYANIQTVRKDGQPIWTLFRASPVTIGGQQNILGRLTDITEDKEREEYLTWISKAVESSGEAIGVINAGNRVIYHNPSLIKLSGYTAEELNDAGGPVKLFPTPDIFQTVIKAASTGETWRRETNICTKDGREVPVLFHVDRVTDDEGNITGFIGTFTDITERKRIEREIAEAKDAAERAADREADARATLQVILDTVPVGIVMGDAASRKITYFSPGAIDILGGPMAPNATEAISESYRLLRPENRSPLSIEDMPIYRSLLKGERMMNMEVLVERLDGTEVTALANSAPVLDQEGDIIAAVVSLTDITEMVELRKVRELQLTQLERALIPAEPSVGPGCIVATAYVPASVRREVAGDFYDVFKTADGKSAILIGDVSGKGIEAASLAAATRSTIRALAYHNSSPATAMTQANSALYTQQPWTGSFVTVFLGIFNPATGDLAYTNAGHPAGIIFRHRTGEVETLEIGGLVVGIEKEYGYPEFHTQLMPHDKFLLYTDGISEAWPGYGEFFNTEGVAGIVKKYGYEAPDELIHRLLDAARDWAGGGLRDDAAVVAVECTIY